MRQYKIEIVINKTGDVITSKIVLPDEMRAADVVRVLDTQSKIVQTSIRTALDKIGYKNEWMRIYKAKKIQVEQVLKLNKQ